MRKKTNPSTDTTTAGKIVLKPIAGIQPRIYVAAGYLVFILGLLFFLTIYPGLRNPGAVVSITTLPEGTSVHIDGIRVGFTPIRTYVPRGSRTIILKKPHFAEKNITLDIPGRVFGSRFFPRRIEMTEYLELHSPRGLLDESHREFSSWALSGEPNPLYPFPPTLSEAAADYAVSGGGNPRELLSMLGSAASGVNSPGIFRDYVRAALVAGSDGRALSPQGLVRTARFFGSLYGSSEHSAYWLSSVLPDEFSALFTGNPAVAAEMEALSSRLKSELRQPAPAAAVRTLNILGREFAEIPGGSFFMGWAGVSDSFVPRDSLSPPVPVEVETFFIATSEVTEEEFAGFLRENPRWAPAGRETLAREGLVEQSYLSAWKDSSLPPRPSHPVREVSHHAARAYCEWLGTRTSLYTFSLPTEAQWEYAASMNLNSSNAVPPSAGAPAPAGAGPRGTAGIRFMTGNLWEWCDDWFSPASYIFPLSGEFPAAEKVVRGGSWINPEGAVTVSTRGSQPPEWCTPYLGFRVIARFKKSSP